MAKRPVFVPRFEGSSLVDEIEISFQWFAGFSKSQAQRSIASLHTSAERMGICPILEISSKSPDDLGVSLSAFNLMMSVPNSCIGRPISVECAFQGSKVFEHGGPYTDLYLASSREAKTDGRIRNSGNIVGFQLAGQEFPTVPLTAFYDWLYITALSQNPELSARLSSYSAFSDIAFNPERSLNCQARSAALFVSLSRNALLECAISDKKYYIDLVSGQVS